MIDQATRGSSEPRTEEQNQIYSEISKALSLRHGANDRICVCAYTRNGDGKFHVNEHFVDGIDAAAQVIESNYKLPEVGAIWSNLQKLQPGATARRPETVEAYTNILIDVDRRVNKNEQGEKVNATDAERAVLLGVANKIMAFLAYEEFGWGKGVMADSGNGYHLEWATKPLNPTVGKEMYGQVLAVLRHKFERPDLNMRIDLAMSNASRVITVWGTWNRKYPHTEERPQRQTKILFSPRKLTPLSESLIDLVFLENPIPGDDTRTGRRTDKSGKDFPELDPDWLDNYGPEHLCEWGMPYTPLDGSYEKNAETHYRLDNCILSDKGTDGFHQHHGGNNKRQTELILGQTLGMECFSDDCTDFTFGDWLRRLQELKGEKYPHRIFLDDAEELAEIFGAEDATAETPIEESLPVIEPEENAGEYTMVTQGNSQMIGIRFSDVFSRAMKWVWKGRIPRGKGVILQGPPGVAKSMCSLSLAATITRGADWPDGAVNDMGPRDVVWAGTEDDLEDTVKPRLQALGADMSRISAIKRMVDTSGELRKRRLLLKEDIKALYKLLREKPDIALVIFDPLTGFYGGVDGNSGKEVRPILESLAEVCRNTGVTIMAIVHENRRKDVSALERVLGSSSVGQVFRAGFRFCKDPQNKGGYTMACSKTNFKVKGGLKYTIEDCTVKLDDGTESDDIGMVVWGEAHDDSADDVIQQATEEAEVPSFGGNTDQAQTMLETLLADGQWHPVAALHAEREKLGLTAKEMYNAKTALRLETKGKAPGPWWWRKFGSNADVMDTEVPTSKGTQKIRDL